MGTAGLDDLTAAIERIRDESGAQAVALAFHDYETGTAFGLLRIVPIDALVGHLEDWERYGG